MGVDYTAFSCYGIRVDLVGRKPSEYYDLNESVLAKSGLELVEYGSRQYGGGHGFILAIKDSYAEVDFDDVDEARQMPDARDYRTAKGLYEAVGQLQVVAIGEPSWFVCGRVW